MPVHHKWVSNSQEFGDKEQRMTLAITEKWFLTEYHGRKECIVSCSFIIMPNGKRDTSITHTGLFITHSPIE